MWSSISIYVDTLFYVFSEGIWANISSIHSPKHNIKPFWVIWFRNIEILNIEIHPLRYRHFQRIKDTLMKSDDCFVNTIKGLRMTRVIISFLVYRNNIILFKKWSSLTKFWYYNSNSNVDIQCNVDITQTPIRPLISINIIMQTYDI